MLIYGAGRLQALTMYAGVKEAKAFPSMFDMIMVLAFARGKIQSITSAQGKSSERVATFVILDLIVFHIGVYILSMHME